MVKLNETGAVSGIAVSLSLAIILLIAAIGFGGWAFSSRQDYKNNTDAKITAAVQTAKEQESSLKDQQFAAASKNPLKTYSGPQGYGSISLSYPKTWSGYVDDSGTGGDLINGYFAPGVVPAIDGSSSVFALRMQVVSSTYAQTIQAFEDQTGVTVTAYSLPKLPNVVGVEVTGQLTGQGGPNTTMVILPLRTNTIELSTDGTQYLNDFNTSILPNFSFSP